MINGINVVTQLNIDITFRTLSEYSKMAKQVLLITLVVLSTMLAGIFGTLSCYTCDSYNNRDHTGCVDPMNSDVNVTVCPFYFFVCMRISYITQNTSITTRGCQIILGDPCKYTYSYLHDAHPDLTSFNCYWCLGDYCNSANGSEIQRQLMKEEIDSNRTKGKPVKPFYLSP